MKGGSPGSRLLDWNTAEADSKIKKLTFLKTNCCGCALKRKYFCCCCRGACKYENHFKRFGCEQIAILCRACRPTTCRWDGKSDLWEKLKKKVEERQQLKSPCEVNLFTLQGLVKVSPNPLRPHGEPYLTYPSDPGTLGGSE